MIILGMHFGHDGAVSIIKDGKVVSYISRERISRVKHAIGITTMNSIWHSGKHKFQLMILIIVLLFQHRTWKY